MPGEQETADLIRQAQGRAMAVEVDVTDPHSVEQMVDAAVREFGRLDILVNNAAVGNRDSLLNVMEAEFDRVMAINVKGPLLCARASVPHMLATGGGSIINIVSTSSEMARPNLTVYGTSKGALKMLTKGMAVEWAPYNIRVNGISAGPISTLAARGIPGFTEILHHYRQKAPLRRNIEASEVGDAAAFLLSTYARGITGEILYVDAGYHISGV